MKPNCKKKFFVAIIITVILLARICYGGISFNPNPRRIELISARTSISSIELDIKYMNSYIGLYGNNDGFNAFIVWELENIGNKIVATCCNCNHKELSLILQDKIKNKIIPFVIFLKREGVNDHTRQIFKELKQAVADCRKEYKRISHDTRYEQWKRENEINEMIAVIESNIDAIGYWMDYSVKTPEIRRMMMGAIKLNHDIIMNKINNSTPPAVKDILQSHIVVNLDNFMGAFREYIKIDNSPPKQPEMIEVFKKLQSASKYLRTRIQKAMENKGAYMIGIWQR